MSNTSPLTRNRANKAIVRSTISTLFETIIDLRLNLPNPCRIRQLFCSIQARREKQIEAAKVAAKKKARQKVKQKYIARSQNGSAGEKKQKIKARSSQNPRQLNRRKNHRRIQKNKKQLIVLELRIVLKAFFAKIYLRLTLANRCILLS